MILGYLLGTLAFVSLVLFEMVKCRNLNRKDQGSNPWFVLGVILLVGTYLSAVVLGQPAKGLRFIVSLIILALSVAAYIYLLLYPVKGAHYTGESHGTYVCDKGPYGLVRHPGAWCYLLMAMAFGGMIEGTLVFSLYLCGLNLIYVLVQDKWFFPQYIKGYDLYKQTVPCLLPIGRK
ncbi:MAG: hypothetical protein KBS83_06200 [Lachnospiraceae bacterium]|nr:hypothetical protein [Candidatus Equihabitans merdae]